MARHLLLAAVVFATASTTPLRAADAAEHFKLRPLAFSCDMTMTSERGTTVMHMAMDGAKKRSEVDRPGQKMVMITRGDTRKMLMVMDERKMVMEMPYDERRAQDDLEQLSKDANAKLEPLGSETIRDIVCDKFAITASSGKKSTVWISQQEHTTIRWVNDGSTATVEYSNYKIGPQDAALFEAPAGYTAMAMPGGGAPGGPGTPLPPRRPPTAPPTTPPAP